MLKWFILHATKNIREHLLYRLLMIILFMQLYSQECADHILIVRHMGMALIIKYNHSYSCNERMHVHVHVHVAGVDLFFGMSLSSEINSRIIIICFALNIH